MRYDISYLTIFSPNDWGYIHIHAYTDKYIRHTYKYGNDTDKCMQILPWQSALSPAASARPSTLEGLWYRGPAARGPHAGPGPATVAGRCPTRTDESEATRVHSGRGVPCSGLRTAGPLAANVEAMCEICQAGRPHWGTKRSENSVPGPARSSPLAGFKSS